MSDIPVRHLFDELKEGLEEVEKLRLCETILHCSERLNELGIDFGVRCRKGSWFVSEGGDNLYYNDESDIGTLTGEKYPSYPNEHYRVFSSSRYDLGDKVVFCNADEGGHLGGVTLILSKDKEVRNSSWRECQDGYL